MPPPKPGILISWQTRGMLGGKQPHKELFMIQNWRFIIAVAMLLAAGWPGPVVHAQTDKEYRAIMGAMRDERPTNVTEVFLPKDRDAKQSKRGKAEEVYEASIAHIDRAGAIRSLEKRLRQENQELAAKRNLMKKANVSQNVKKAQIADVAAKSQKTTQELKRVKAGGEIRPEMNPNELRVGDGGVFNFPIELRQIINDTTMLVAPWGGGEPFILKGFSTDGLHDKAALNVSGPVAVTGTTSYRTVLGVRKTVLLVEAVSLMKLDKQN
jgi:hypothetical protein